MKDALIIFVRQPVLGKVKTRLAADIGPVAALAAYQKLVAHTQEITTGLAIHKYVFYADAIAGNDVWKTGYYKALQEGNDLGERMKNAFTFLFRKGYNRICIIGSDCLHLTSSIILQAFTSLAEQDFVIGPAKDGGYYLLGMKDMVKPVFDNIPWSTAVVFKKTMELIKQQSYTYFLLPQLTDVDTIADLPTGFLDDLPGKREN